MELVKDTSNTSTSPQHSHAVSQLVEFSWKATRGLVEATENQVQQLVDRLVTAGKISAEERTRLVTLIDTRLTDSRKRFLQTIDAHVRTAVEKLSALSEQEINSLQASVADLEKRIQQL